MLRYICVRALVGPFNATPAWMKAIHRGNRFPPAYFFQRVLDRLMDNARKCATKITSSLSWLVRKIGAIAGQERISHRELR